VGSGEGIFGIADGYPPDVPAAPKSRLQSIERRALEWRFRLSNRVARLSRIHGDFHPFNVLFTDQGELSLLDASRGSMGEPADDVGCMAINYVFFALEKPELWRQGFAELWHRFWRTYLEQSNDYEVLEVVAPFLAWRGLVLASPVWYPALETNARDRLLSLVERALDSPSFDPSFAEVVFK
jgi:aminoglycoside phosphotransferase family enzyme